MKELFKISLYILLVVALSPFLGFWLVALVGALVFLLPVGLALATLFPNTWHHVENDIFARFLRLSTS